MMKYAIKWLGHAAVEITTAEGTVIYIDPWLENGVGNTTVDSIEKADIVLLTHDHFDHRGNAGAIMQKCKNAILVAQPELLGVMQQEYGIPDEQMVNGGGGMNIGGTVQIKDVRITMTEATHSSNTGEPSGFILEIGGERIYHAGDTALFATMLLLAKLYPMKVALLPIGGVFTMDPVQAAEAAKILGVETVIPIHYKSFPILEPNADRFVALTREVAPNVNVIVPEPGEAVEF